MSRFSPQVGLVKLEPINIDAQNQTIGIDLGIKTFALMSNREKAKSPDYSKLDRKIRKLWLHHASYQKGKSYFLDLSEFFGKFGHLAISSQKPATLKIPISLG
ncbi:MAG: hypothetical protein ACKPE3_32540 [Sphaerospermopsis kisseleviana]